MRSERALLLTLAEMYVQGVSTRKVAAITERLCGTQISASQVSRAAQTLDEELQTWRTRPLGEIVYLYLDARYEKVRQAGSVLPAAILMASGVKKGWQKVNIGHFSVLERSRSPLAGFSGRVGQARLIWCAVDRQ
jgi:transposase-like protein